MTDSLTVLARFVAEDAASAQIGKVDKSITELDKHAKQASGGMNKLGDAAKQNKVSLSGMQTAITGAVTALAGLQALNFLSGMRQHGEEVRKTTNEYRVLADAAGSADATLAALRARTRGMVSDTDLMAGAAQLLGSNLAKSNEEAVTLIGLASDLGATTDQLFSVLANQSFAVLDSFKVNSARVRELRDQYIAAGMDSAAAFNQAFIIAATETRDRMQDAIDANLSPTQQLETRWANFWDQFSMGAANAVNSALTSIEQLNVIGQATLGVLPEQNPATDADRLRAQELVSQFGSTDAALQQVGLMQGESAVPGSEQLRLENAIREIAAGMDQYSTEMDVPAQIEAVTSNTEAIHANTDAQNRAADLMRTAAERALRDAGFTPQTELDAETFGNIVRDVAERDPEHADELYAALQQLTPEQLGQGLTQALLSIGIVDNTPGQGNDAVYDPAAAAQYNNARNLSPEQFAGAIEAMNAGVGPNANPAAFQAAWNYGAPTNLGPGSILTDTWGLPRMGSDVNAPVIPIGVGGPNSNPGAFQDAWNPAQADPGGLLLSAQEVVLNAQNVTPGAPTGLTPGDFLTGTWGQGSQPSTMGAPEGLGPGSVLTDTWGQGSQYPAFNPGGHGHRPAGVDIQVPDIQTLVDQASPLIMTTDEISANVDEWSADVDNISGKMSPIADSTGDMADNASKAVDPFNKIAESIATMTEGVKTVRIKPELVGSGEGNELLKMLIRQELAAHGINLTGGLR